MVAIPNETPSRTGHAQRLSQPVETLAGCRVALPLVEEGEGLGRLCSDAIHQTRTSGDGGTRLLQELQLKTRGGEKDRDRRSEGASLLSV